jgi:hypothetical protein
MHANYFVNVGGGTAADVRTLIEHARRVVADRFGVTLKTEVKLVAPDGRYELVVHGTGSTAERPDGSPAS